MDFNEENSLYLDITKFEFWKKEINENENFESEIKGACPKEIKISNCKKLYDFLDGDSFIKNEIKEKNEIKIIEDKILLILIIINLIKMK